MEIRLLMAASDKSPDEVRRMKVRAPCSAGGGLTREG